MNADYERQLLARARDLAGVADLRDETLACLGAARHAGLDPGALAGLVGCAAALGASATATYTAGDGWTGQHAGEHHFLAHIHSIDDNLDERIHAARRLSRDTAAALDAARQDMDEARGQLAAARSQLAAARAMPAAGPCASAATAPGQAGTRIRECATRTEICQQVTSSAGALATRLRYALIRIRAVPADLGETYESVYNLIRRGGVLPRDGRWLTGAGTTA